MEVLQQDVVFIVFVFSKTVPAFLWSFYQNWCRVLCNISDALLIRSLSFVGGLCDFCRGTAVHEGHGRAQTRRGRHWGRTFHVYEVNFLLDGFIQPFKDWNLKVFFKSSKQWTNIHSMDVLMLIHKFLFSFCPCTQRRPFILPLHRPQTVFWK